jgi:hypothetical protein
MTTIIRNSDGSIKTFTERGDDVALAPGETMEESPLSFAEYASRLRISLSGRSGETITIPTGSPDQTISVSCPGESSVTLFVNGFSETVPLVNGAGTLTLSAEVPGRYIILPADSAKYCAAGESVLILEVK